MLCEFATQSIQSAICHYLIEKAHIHMLCEIYALLDTLTKLVPKSTRIHIRCFA